MKLRYVKAMGLWFAVDVVGRRVVSAYHKTDSGLAVEVKPDPLDLDYVIGEVVALAEVFG